MLCESLLKTAEIQQVFQVDELMHATVRKGGMIKRARLVPLADVSLSLPIHSSIQGSAAVSGKPASAEGASFQPCMHIMGQSSKCLVLMSGSPCKGFYQSLKLLL